MAAIDPLNCPACGGDSPLAERVAGVCPRCAKNFRAAHAPAAREAQAHGPKSKSGDIEEGNRKAPGAPQFVRFEGDSMVQSTEDVEDPGDAEFALEFGTTTAMAREMRLAIIERLGARGARREAGTGEGVTSDEARRSGFEGAEGHGSGPAAAMFRRALRIVRGAGSWRERSDRLDYLCLALRWFDELGGIDNPTDLGKRLQVTKANATKYVNLFRDILPPGLATMPTQPGQRSEAARKKFADIRREQERGKGK